MCYCARVRVTRERERLTLFSFFCVTDELIQKRERGVLEKDDVAASFRVVFDDFDFGWFVQQERRMRDDDDRVAFEEYSSHRIVVVEIISIASRESDVDD